jgi:hypothetical protein
MTSDFEMVTGKLHPRDIAFLARVIPSTLRPPRFRVDHGKRVDPRHLVSEVALGAVEDCPDLRRIVRNLRFTKSCPGAVVFEFLAGTFVLIATVVLLVVNRVRAGAGALGRRSFGFETCVGRIAGRDEKPSRVLAVRLPAMSFEFVVVVAVAVALIAYVAVVIVVVVVVIVVVVVVLRLYTVRKPNILLSLVLKDRQYSE